MAMVSALRGACTVVKCTPIESLINVYAFWLLGHRHSSKTCFCGSKMLRFFSPIDGDRNLVLDNYQMHPSRFLHNVWCKKVEIPYLTNQKFLSPSIDFYASSLTLERYLGQVSLKNILLCDKYVIQNEGLKAFDS